MDRVCPLLGLQADRRTAIDGVDAGHRCYAEATPIPLDRQQQARLCLTADHERCERYLAHAARNGGLRPAHAGIVEGLVSTRLILAPDPAWRGIAGRARRAPAGPLLTIAAAGVALGIGGVAVASGAIGEAFPGIGSIEPERPSPSPTPTIRVTPSPTPSATPTATPSPTPSPTQVPSPSPTVAVTPAPTAQPPPPPQETYVVQEGDTLAAIAQRFGTTVSALQAANGIEDPDVIVIGQVLVIP
ncbi:MAG: LysM peptidoglycan-binding domain-containing protein [Candidatus Limnocylindria bacterium]